MTFSLNRGDISSSCDAFLRVIGDMIGDRHLLTKRCLFPCSLKPQRMSLRLTLQLAARFFTELPGRGSIKEKIALGGF